MSNCEFLCPLGKNGKYCHSSCSLYLGADKTFTDNYNRNSNERGCALVRIADSVRIIQKNMDINGGGNG